MRVALDTNRHVDLCKGVGETLALLEEAEAIMLPLVVVGKLRAGFAHGRRPAENERILRRFLLKDGVRVIFADDQTTHLAEAPADDLGDLWAFASVRQFPVRVKCATLPDRHFVPRRQVASRGSRRGHGRRGGLIPVREGGWGGPA